MTKAAELDRWKVEILDQLITKGLTTRLGLTEATRSSNATEGLAAEIAEPLWTTCRPKTQTDTEEGIARAIQAWLDAHSPHWSDV